MERHTYNMQVVKWCFTCFLIVALSLSLQAQLYLNEGSNKNYLRIADENGDYPDWIELYNAGSDTVSLYNYSLTDDENHPAKWVFPNVSIPPNSYKIVFCSGKDRKPVSGFVNVLNTGTYNPYLGWNTHEFTTPFYWDGVSNILISTCSYSSTGYTSNSVFNQSLTPFASSAFSFQDGSEAACYAPYGSLATIRPNMRLNGIAVGTGAIQNSPTDYPAPYGNWWWGAKNQMLILASELNDAGLNEGWIENLAFDVAGTDPNTIYDYIDFSFKLVSKNSLSSEFETVDFNNNLHTNFKIGNNGEMVSLYSPEQTLISSLFVNCNDLDISNGLLPDGSDNVVLFQNTTPAATNNLSAGFSSYLVAPVFSETSGIYNSTFSVSITNPNSGDTEIFFTTDGSEPTPSSTLYTGPIPVFYSIVLKARAFSASVLPSPVAVSSYLLGVSHTTPVLSVVTDYSNLYGPSGIFENWQFDWQRAAYAEYFDTTQQLIFSQRAGIQVDGGWGGSRYHAQHSFRVELDNAVLGDGPIDYPLIPNRPQRTKYSKFYLRNGSNQFLTLPYKDACQVELMAGQTNTYYSAWRPVTVYINGAYFGLYEMREKFDLEYFETLENADPDSTDILSLSAWYNGVLRAVEGSVDSFFTDYSAFNQLNPSDTTYWNQADQYFDLVWYTDYIIGTSWMGNADWPGNNIKIYRSNSTGFKWRYCLIDLELALAPNGWTDFYFDHIEYMLSQSSGNPFINVWLKSMQNERYRNYFINRFADVMNTAYLPERLISIENSFFDQTVIEMQNEYARWGNPNNIVGQMNNFFQNHLIFQDQLLQRTPYVRSHIETRFDLPNQVLVSLNCFPEGSGTIQISTITPDTYPWQGVYFNGVPVKIEAKPAEGFQFQHWENNGLITDTLIAVFRGELDAASISFNAFFEPFIITQTQTPEPKISEFQLYPNPTADYLFVKHLHQTNNTGNLTCQIVDMTGRVLQQQKLSLMTGTTQINLQHLPASVYIAQISDNNGQIAQIRFAKISR
ncbi:MAG: CotH kinase family protein [Sphingobacteriales bacterium]|nr:MAG: CotH kinase family protein [Sphingobacteriales bacterium]